MVHSGLALNVFASASEMRAAALEICAARLSKAISVRGRALFLVSGGATPLPLYEALSQAALDWARVDIALVDERWAGLEDAASNERAIRASLLRGPAASAKLTALKTRHAAPADAQPVVERLLADLPWPADIAILGMGPDGHTASWFPNAYGLAEAIDPEAKTLCAAVEARESAVTGKHTQRMTLTAPAIAGAGAVLLLMTGDEKRRAFARARASGPVEDMPVRALFAGDPDRRFCFWAP